MNDAKGPTLDQIASLKLRLRSLPDELNVAREAASRLGTLVKGSRADVADREAEVAALARAELMATARAAIPAGKIGKLPAEATLTAVAKQAIDGDETVGHLRSTLRDVQLRHEAAERQVKHLEDRFRGLQVYADLTACEVRLLVSGFGA